MKYIFTAIFYALLAVACAPHRQEQPLRKVEYNFPPGITADKKEAFIKDFNSGRIFYNIHCAKCHSRVSNGKELLPAFSPKQILSYDIRLASTRHRTELTERKVPEEEMEAIKLFLLYKKHDDR